jgi:hypothetical protein
MEPECSSPCSQQPATGTYTEPAESSWHSIPLELGWLSQHSDDRGIYIRFSEWAEVFLLTTASRSALEFPTSYLVGSGASSPRVKRPRREAGNASPSISEIKNAWSNTSIPPYIFMVCCLINDREISPPIYSIPARYNLKLFSHHCHGLRREENDSRGG